MLPSEAPFAIVELPNDDIWMNKTKMMYVLMKCKKKKNKSIFGYFFQKLGRLK